ncbi:signal peptide peptidase SppA [Sneathiella sp. P13V-1]|uniref:signal peptide peptidase SppA n=1 Tax=Sneathiella sp. P13V-1 TaxID=2697366 RepID=UPI00187B7780|nr:signal peptide peptidase SppA [Sneathiella sp. P13V-1]MBE7636113.1 signal peptide peptidase SppA [Sneathiella sp. P13V-1]
MSSETFTHHDRRRAKRRLFFWRAAAVILLLIVIGMFVGMSADEIAEDHVARLNINNVIVEDEWRQEAIQGILEDDTAKALIVYINSPGGSTYGSERLYKSLRRVAEKKPVISVIGTVGASGGYLTALAGEQIFAGESSITGSIGVIIQLTEFSELMDTLGIKGDAITSGELKGEPSPFKPLSAAGRANLQEMVSSTHEWFVDLVTERRPISREEAEALANGGIYIGKKAVTNGLIDQLGGLYEARRWLESDRQIPGHLPTLIHEYGPPKGLVDQLLEGMLGKSVISERLTLDGLVSLWHPSANRN